MGFLIQLVGSYCAKKIVTGECRCRRRFQAVGTLNPLQACRHHGYPLLHFIEEKMVNIALQLKIMTCSVKSKLYDTSK